MKHTHRMHTIAGLAIALALVVSLVLPAGPVLAQEDGDAYAVQWSGVIDAIDAGQWTVAGQAVVISPTTVIPFPGAELGMWADVQARRDGDTLVARRITVSPPEMRLRGEISFIPEGRIGQWIIGGQPFEVTAATAISERGGPVEVGAWAQVSALEQDDALGAQRIRAIDPLPAVEVYGAIQAFSDTQWTISGVDLAVNADTLISSEPRVGLLANAAAALQADDSLLALRIRVLWQEHGGPQPPVTLTGVIERIPPNGVVGQWVVAGLTVVVSRNTLINENNGMAVVGAEVTVIGQQADATIVAREIVVLTSPASGERVHFEGRIESLPDSGLLGDWTIAGQTVQVTENTRLLGERFVRIGAVVQVWGLRQSSGVVYATNMVVHPWRPGGESIDLSTDTGSH